MLCACSLLVVHTFPRYRGYYSHVNSNWAAGRRAKSQLKCLPHRSTEARWANCALYSGTCYILVFAGDP